MSIDHALWRWKDDPPRITAGLCYLLLAEAIRYLRLAWDNGNTAAG